MLDSLISSGSIRIDGDALAVTTEGERRFSDFGLDIVQLQSSKRPLCKSCRDWSERRTHLAGTLGKALLQHFLQNGWARRSGDSRAMLFTPEGEKKFLSQFPL
jgi:hypothetical protein